MIKVLVYIGICLILTIFETTFVKLLPIDFFKPDVGIPFVVYTTFFIGPQAGLVTSVLVGLMQEVVSSSPAGTLLFTKVSLFVVSFFMRNTIYIDSKYSFAFVCSGAVMAESLLFLVLAFLARGESRDVFNVAFYTVPNAIFTGFLSIALFSLIGFLNSRYLSRHT